VSEECKSAGVDRGLARGPTIQALRALIRAHRPDLLFLSEIKVACSHFQPSLLGLGFSTWFEAPPSGLQGGLYMTWKHGVDVEPVRINKNCISCLVFYEPSQTPWLLSGVYTLPTSQDRSAFWDFFVQFRELFWRCLVGFGRF
jgi:hypothetical protein